MRLPERVRGSFGKAPGATSRTAVVSSLIVAAATALSAIRFRNWSCNDLPARSRFLPSMGAARDPASKQTIGNARANIAACILDPTDVSCEKMENKD